ncbi:MAG: DUF134 domain-containing protein [Parachlamydiales bacterium]|nr:DUF134 domain-containing protein [Parachlamydiales bacterium]
MPRLPRKKSVFLEPKIRCFKPAGVRQREVSSVCLLYEELEALRLKDWDGKDQKDIAMQMGVSQPTVHRLIQGGRKKIIEALVFGKAINIEGGHYIMKKQTFDLARMTIAVSAFSQDLEGDMDSRFGRCSYFLLISIENGAIASFKAIKNEQADMRGGAGIMAAQTLADHHVDVVLSDHIGPRAEEVLHQFQIPVYRSSGNIRQSVQHFIEGKLNPIKEAL